MQLVNKMPQEAQVTHVQPYRPIDVLQSDYDARRDAQKRFLSNYYYAKLRYDPRPLLGEGEAYQEYLAFMHIQDRLDTNNRWHLVTINLSSHEHYDEMEGQLYKKVFNFCRSKDFIASYFVKEVGEHGTHPHVHIAVFTTPSKMEGMVRSHAFNTFKDIVEQQYINVKHSPIALDYIQKAGHPTKVKDDSLLFGLPQHLFLCRKTEKQNQKMKTFYRTQHQHAPQKRTRNEA